MAAARRADRPALVSFTVSADRAAQTGRLPEWPVVPRWWRRVLAGLLASAGLVHLVLSPEHFGERVDYGVFFLTAGCTQLGLAVLLAHRRDPSLWCYQLVAYASLGLITTWLITRAVAVPGTLGAETVTPVGVVATTLELAALLAVLFTVPLTTRGRRGRPLTWAAACGLGYAVLFALAASLVTYSTSAVSGPGEAANSLTVAWGPLGTRRPFVSAVLGRHLLLAAPLVTLIFLVVAASLVTANIALSQVRLCRTTGGPQPARAPLLAAAPSLFAVPVCCGTPLVGVLGGGAFAPLLAATPYLLAAVVLLLAGQLVLNLRRRRPMGAG